MQTERAIAAAVVATALSGLGSVIARSDPAPADHSRPRVSALHDFYDRRALRQDKGVVPTEAAARALLAEMVEKAKTRNPIIFCELVHPPLLCFETWREDSDAAIPAKPPHILDSYVHDGGRVLVVCGRDGRGELYRSEIPVYQFEGKTLAILGPYWHSFRYGGIKSAEEPVHATPGGQPPIDAAACGSAM